MYCEMVSLEKYFQKYFEKVKQEQEDKKFFTPIQDLKDAIRGLRKADPYKLIPRLSSESMYNYVYDYGSNVTTSITSGTYTIVSNPFYTTSYFYDLESSSDDY